MCPGCNKRKKENRRSLCSACRGWYSRHFRKLEFVNLLGGKCSECGCKDIPCLDFHHINPNEKDSTVNDLLNSHCKSAIEEVKKCILLCANCHRRLHYKYREDIAEFYTKYYTIEKRNCESDIKCGRNNRRLKNRITPEELSNLIWTLTIADISIKFDVNRNTISKWCKKYSISKPPQGYWNLSESKRKLIRDKIFKDI